MAILKPNIPLSIGVNAVFTDRLKQNNADKRVEGDANHFGDFNLANHVGDSPAIVAHNRAVLRQNLDLIHEPCWLEQIHSNKLVKAVPNQLQTADASWSDEVGVPCVVMTADCLPILLANSEDRIVAAVHAGWRGLLNGIITNTFDFLTTLSDKPWHVWFGPAIGQTAFEVGEEVYEAFVQQSSVFDACFQQSATTPGKYLASLTQIAEIYLNPYPIAGLYQQDICTYSDPNYYSYRRDGVTGRMASMIWLS